VLINPRASSAIEHIGVTRRESGIAPFKIHVLAKVEEERFKVLIRSLLDDDEAILLLNEHT
jgi:hypothetical protein